MSINLSKGKAILFLIAIMVANVAVMGEYAFYPIVNKIYEIYGESVNATNYIVSGPMVLVILSSLAAPFIMRKTSKKRFLIFSGIIFCISSIFCMSVDNLGYIMVMRSLMGIAEGFANVASVAIIAEVYIDDAKRGYIMGIYNAAMAAVGAFLSLLSGILATGGWQLAFRTYWIGILVVILMILFLPDIKPEKTNEEKTLRSNDRLGSKYWAWISVFTLTCLFYASIVYFISVYVAEHNLGTVAFAGLISSLHTTGGFVACCIFGIFYKKFKRRIPLVALILMAIGVILLIFFPNKPVLMIASLLIGSMYSGGIYAFGFTYAPELVPESKIDTGISLTTAGYGIGFFGSTYFVTFLEGVMNTTEYSSVLPVLAVAFIVLAVVEVILGKERK